MTSAIEGHFDPSDFKLPSLDAPSPPCYTEKRISPVPNTNLKANEDTNYTHRPWLLKKTSVHVESTPSNVLEDNLSDHSSITTTRSDEKRAVRNLLSRFGRQTSGDERPDDRASVADSHETSLFGTTVSIEAGHSKRSQTKQRELKGLEEAASVRRWAGDGKPAEAWGKLAKDPELWDSQGDVLVYFGYQRPHASFRIRSSILEATQSDVLIGKLQDGFQRNPKALLSTPSSPTAIRNLSVDQKGHHPAPSNADSVQSRNESNIRYEIHFPPPDEGSKTTILRHHITTRNFFAMLLRKPLVGLTFYQALVDLHQRLQIYMPRNVKCTDFLKNYLTENNLHNVSNDPAAAAGLLAWCEDAEVRWQAGWRESFVHCCGMYAHLQSLPEMRDISHVTRTLLERSHLELEARIQVAESRLSNFDFDDMWSGSEAQLHPSRAIFDRFRGFLQQYYSRTYKRWPPSSNEAANGAWLTSDIVFRLQRDFAALFEYHVDRDVVWDKIKDPHTMHWNMICESSGHRVESKDTEVCLGKLLYRFDEKQKYDHLPRPFHLLPDSTAMNGELKPSKNFFFGSKARALGKRVIHAFSEASNATLLGPDVAANGLAEAFLRFEKSDSIGDTDAQSARKARWMLLYGILQVLSTLSVDTPNLSFTENVSYFLNPRLKGAPPWKTEKRDGFEEASPRLSYCWVAPNACWGNPR